MPEVKENSEWGNYKNREHVTKSWSHTQAAIALSSGEAEYYGMVKEASYSLGIQSLAGDLG